MFSVFNVGEAASLSICLVFCFLLELLLIAGGDFRTLSDGCWPLIVVATSVACSLLAEVLLSVGFVRLVMVDFKSESASESLQTDLGVSAPVASDSSLSRGEPAAKLQCILEWSE